jgi:hypothetical protein
MKFCIIGPLVLTLAAVIGHTGCRTSSGDTESALLDNSTPISAPFASGDATDMKWAIRFNFPECDHQGQKKGAWCESTDATASTKKNGVEDHLKSWIENPKVKVIKMAYFSFSNKNIVKLLCDAATGRGLKATLYIHGQSIVDNVNTLKACSPQNIQVIERGTTFGTNNGYLQHAKIFLASEVDVTKPLADLTGQEATDMEASTVHIASSSANMSSFGTSLHFENWMFLDANAKTQVAQTNLCFFKAIEDMTGTDRDSFAAIYKDCREKITAPANDEIVFYPVPHGKINPEIYKSMLDLIKTSTVSIKVGIHRLTASGVFKALADKASTIPVSVILDDDILRTGVKNGGKALDVGANDVLAYRTVRDAGAKVVFMETNADTTTHLFHNKFMVFDEKTVLAGAGNFTATSLNTFNNGNIEHFYIIKQPGIVKAYSDAFDKLQALATPAAQHAVGSNVERGLNCSGLCDFTN